MPNTLLIANWKMNKTHVEASAFVRAFADERLPKQVSTVLCPAFTALQATEATLAQWVEHKGAKPYLGAQDCAATISGAFTGEVAAPMLTALGCSHVLLGHSERRSLFGENDAHIAGKVMQAIAHDLCAVLCIGETQEERDAAQTMTVLRRQLQAAVPREPQPQADKLVIAYEPVWAIGTGRVAATEQIAEVMAFLRGELIAIYGEELGSAIPLLYGGSVNAANIATLPECGADGALVGGASLKPEIFAELARTLAEARGLR